MLPLVKRIVKGRVGIISILFAFAFSSCVKDMGRPIASAQYTPLLAAPIINSTLGVNNLLVKDNKNGSIQADSTNFLSLIYRGRLFSLVANSIVKIPNQVF